jgi:hypothetical protein
MQPEILDAMSDEALTKAAVAEGWHDQTAHEKGKNNGEFLNAREFLDKSEEILPIVRGQNKKLRRRLEKAEKSIEELTATSRESNALLQRTIKREQAESERLTRELEQKRANAISEGDGQAAVAAEREIAHLKQQHTVPAYDQQSMDTITKAWLADNTWYETDEGLKQWADGRSKELAESVPAGPQRLAAIAEDARRLFPERTSAVNGEQMPGSIDPGGRSSGRPTGNKGFDDLPQDAKDAYSRFEKVIPNYSKAQYLKSYEWE